MDVVIDKFVSCGAIRHFWGGWLSVAHIYKQHVCCHESLTVYKRSAQLCFHCASKDVSHGRASDMHWYIEWQLLDWGLVWIL